MFQNYGEWKDCALVEFPDGVTVAVLRTVDGWRAAPNSPDFDLDDSPSHADCLAAARGQ